MDYQYDNAGPSPDAASSGFRFGDLPYDIRYQIWHDALPPTTIRFMYDGGTTQTLRGDARNVSQVNRESRAEVLATHRCRLWDGTLNLVRMDPVHDTFLTHNLSFPTIRKLPFRNVVSTFKKPDHYRFGWMRSWIMHGMHELQLSRLPRLHEYTMLFEEAKSILWIPGCQMYDPQPISVQYPARLAIG